MPNSPRWALAIRSLRLAALIAGALALLFLVLLGVHQALLPLLATCFPELEGSFYEIAVYGVYRTREYVSFDFSSPRVNVLRWDDVCDSGHVFLGPYGDSVSVPGPSILDARGELVWFTDEFEQVTNFQMQQYRGRNFLTFWAGHKVGGVGQGALYMLDETYAVAHKVQAVGEGMKGDLHEFQITQDGTALITIYNKTQADLRPLGLFRGEQGWVSDCILQEIDIETGELLFQWAAVDHVRPERTFYTHPLAGFVSKIPFDYFHINSIEKDSYGNYLISSRHFHTLTYISGSTGDILWELGGDSTDFTDLSDGAASSFKWQHHARWYSREEGLLTVFDNGVAGPLHVDAPTSKASLLKLDLENMTATHIQSFYPAANVLSSSQGSVQALPDGRLFTGWGSSAAWTEHALDGTLQCEVHFSASIAYAWEWVKSYRAFKAWGWVGRPSWPPSARIARSSGHAGGSGSGGELFVSWNGATEVRGWQLQGRRVDAQGKQDFEVIDEVEKDGFESSFTLPPWGEYRRYRVAALDEQGDVMMFSPLVEPVRPPLSVWALLFGLGFGFAGLVGGLGMLRWWRRRCYCAVEDGGHSAAAAAAAARRWGTAWEPKNLLNWSRGQYRYSKL